MPVYTGSSKFDILSWKHAHALRETNRKASFSVSRGDARKRRERTYTSANCKITPRDLILHAQMHTSLCRTTTTSVSSQGPSSEWWHRRRYIFFFCRLGSPPRHRGERDLFFDPATSSRGMRDDPVTRASGFPTNRIDRRHVARL